jgi:microcystin-dependent protein
MSEPFIGEIKMFGGNFAPRGWASCDGQLMSIAQNDALFALIGTIYGGDGQTTFALPDLRGRVPIGVQAPIGTVAGAEQVTLTSVQNPVHSHPALNGSNGISASPLNGFWATDVSGNTGQYSNQAPNALMAPDALTIAGGAQPHTNVQPYLCIRYIIALEGIFPSRN